jgi:hypothetical protein
MVCVVGVGGVGCGGSPHLLPFYMLHQLTNLSQPTLHTAVLTGEQGCDSFVTCASPFCFIASNPGSRLEQRHRNLPLRHARFQLLYSLVWDCDAPLPGGYLNRPRSSPHHLDFAECNELVHWLSKPSW